MTDHVDSQLDSNATAAEANSHMPGRHGVTGAPSGSPRSGLWLTLAVGQFAPVLGDVQGNRETIVGLVRDAMAAKADLLVLPELASSGYNFENEAQAAATAELADPGAGGAEAAAGTVAAIREALATAAGGPAHTIVVFGQNERDPGGGDRRFNSAVVVNASGVLGVYRKQHLFYREKDLFEPGDDGYFTLDLPLPAAGDGATYRLGVLVCYDWHFVESWKVLMLRGCDVVALPANLVLAGRCQSAVPVMAMMHRYVVALANRTGAERDLAFSGHSLIAGPDGAILAEAPQSKGAGELPTLHVADVDLAACRDKDTTPRNNLLSDRRPAVYRAITDGV